MNRFLVVLSVASMFLFSYTVAGQNVLSLSMGKGDRRSIAGGTWIESMTPCRLDVTMEGEKVSEIAVYPADPAAKEVKLITNQPFHMASNRVTTIWDDETGQEMVIVRLPSVENPGANLDNYPVERFKIQDGPLTSDGVFFGEVLNLDYPGLEGVKAAVAGKDWSAARKAYVKYLKTRETPKWFFDWRGFDKETSRVAGYDTSAADKVEGNLLTSCSVPYQFGSHINWSINPTEPYYVEWTWQLSRHSFWGTLGKAYWATGDEKYAKAFVKQLRGWIIDNPLPGYAAEEEYSRWRPLETGLRARSTWPEAFFRFLGSPSFDDESIVMMVKSFYEHGVHLEKHHSSKGNHLTSEMNGLYHISVLFPEFMVSPKWEKYAVDKLCAEQDIQFLPDGAQVELTPHYHGVTLRDVLAVYPFARINGKTLPEGYLSKLEKMYEYYAKIRFPDGSCPALNDSYPDENADVKLKEGLSYFPARTDFLYVMTGGTEGTAPSFTSVWMPWAGWYNMRSGWDTQALHAHFNVGPFSGWHSHEDALSLLLSAYGDRLLTECGIYPYDTSQWRAYCLSARAHNVVRVDGMDQEWRNALNGGSGQNSEAMGNRWITSDRFDFGEGWYDTGYGPRNDSTVTQYRALLFLKDRCWLMFDMFTPADGAAHTYETSFHLNEAEAEVKPELRAVVGTHEGTANLAIVPLRPGGMDANIVCGQETPEVQGWIHDESCGEYGCRPVATPIFKRVASGQWVEPYLLYPVKAGEECPVTSVKSEDGGRYVISFKDGTKLSVNLAAGAGALSSLSYSVKGGKGASVSVKVL